MTVSIRLIQIAAYRAGDGCSGPGAYLEGAAQDDFPLDSVGHRLRGVLGYFGLSTFRKGHYWMFWIGFFFPILWIVGTLIAPTPRAAGTA